MQRIYESSKSNKPVSEISQWNQSIKSVNQISQSNQPIKSANQISQSNQFLINQALKEFMCNNERSAIISQCLLSCHLTHFAVFPFLHQEQEAEKEDHLESADEMDNVEDLEELQKQLNKLQAQLDLALVHKHNLHKELESMTTRLRITTATIERFFCS